MNILNNKVFILLLALHNITTASQYFQVINVAQLLKKYPKIHYQKCFDAFNFEFEPFPLSINPDGHPNKGTFLESFILTIPNAHVQGKYGFVTVDNYFIQELMWKQMTNHLRLLHPINPLTVQKISGRVAVIAQLAYFNYWHWLTEVLCRLALLELSNTQYDYLYVATDMPYIKDTLQLWGIAREKIITPTHDHFCIQASQVIVPSLTSNNNLGFAGAQFACYVQPHLIEYVRNKLLSAALTQQAITPLNDKVFVSRKDSGIRNIINEDEIFNILQAHGFVRYELSRLSVVDQIQLFHHAQIIVCPQGTGMANSMFCQPTTKVIELFQGLNDCTFWYLSQILPMQYTAVQTTEFIPDWYTAWQRHTHIPPSIINEVLKLL